MVETGGDIWVVRVIKCNVITNVYPSPSASASSISSAHYEPPGETFNT